MALGTRSNHQHSQEFSWYSAPAHSSGRPSAFQFPTDSLTANAQSHLILNFCLDVGGFGVLGVIVAWMIWARASWTGYLIGVVAIGICDLSFLFVLVTSGIIVANVPTIAGPIIWFLAVAITPFGMPALRRSRTDSQPGARESGQVTHPAGR